MGRTKLRIGRSAIGPVIVAPASSRRIPASPPRAGASAAAERPGIDAGASPADPPPPEPRVSASDGAPPSPPPRVSASGALPPPPRPPTIAGAESATEFGEARGQLVGDRDVALRLRSLVRPRRGTLEARLDLSGGLHPRRRGRRGSGG